MNITNNYKNIANMTLEDATLNSIYEMFKSRGEYLILSNSAKKSFHDFFNKITNAESDTSKQEHDTELTRLRDAAMPLIKYLSDNHHPHVTVVVTSNGAELLEGKYCTGNVFDHPAKPTT